MAFRGSPETIDEVVAWVQEQLRSIQAPASSGRFAGPPGPPGAPAASTTDDEVWRWAEVSP